MDNLERFLHNLNARQKLEQAYVSNEEKIRDVALKSMQDRVTNLKDDHGASLQKIKENLESLTSCEHFIQKRQDSICSENTGLPVSTIHHETMINFTKESLALLNKFGNSDSIKSSQLDKNLMEIVEALKNYNENLAKLVRKEKLTIDDGESAMKNIQILIDKFNEVLKYDENESLKLNTSELEKSIL